MIVDVITVTCGRDFYLKKSLISLSKHKDRIHHIMILNACEVSKEILDILNYTGSTILIQEQRISIGECLNKYKKLFKSDLVLKLDDDAIIQSDNFFEHAIEVHKHYPEAVFSPFPVGLINNFGGPQAVAREVIYSENTDTYYTLREVKHVGGFARFTPLSIYNEVNFGEAVHSEDTELSKWCGLNGKKMFYLDNALIVEHSESTLGQIARDKSYFSRTRDWMKK